MAAAGPCLRDALSGPFLLEGTFCPNINVAVFSDSREELVDYV
jgi:hypothetical protein